MGNNGNGTETTKTKRQAQKRTGLSVNSENQMGIFY